MQQFTVPQFLDVEDKILGPISVRQFVILLFGGLLLFVFYKLFSFTYFVVAGVILITMVGTLAFFRVNGMPFHFFLLNLVQTSRRPKTRVWLKNLTTGELKAILFRKPEIEKVEALVLKKPLKGSSLSEISLVVDTGGVYRGEQEESI